MTEGRCDLLLLACTAFVCFALVSDSLWSSGVDTGQHDVATAPEGVVTARLFRGEYHLMSNRSKALPGMVRMTVAMRASPAKGISISEVALVLLGEEEEGTGVQELAFSGLDFGEVGKIVSSGASDPMRFSLFGAEPCRLEAVISTNGETATGEVISPECGVSLRLTASEIDVRKIGRKVVHYSIWANLLAIIQIRCFLTQLRHTDEGPSVGKVSIVGVGMQALMDAYDSFLHLCLGLSAQYMFNTFAVVSLFKFMLFSLFEMRYLLAVWRSRRREAFGQGWEVVRRELTWLYSRFYGLLVVGLVMIYNFLPHLALIALCFQLYWVPQIVHDVRHGTRNALHPAFIVGIAVTRSLLPMYLWGCPVGVFSGDIYPRLPSAPSAGFCVGVVFLQLTQVGIMVAQRVIGPRWFVPWICLPHVYNYYRVVTAPVHAQNVDCVICMAEVGPEDPTHVITPCDHRFHRACLDKWMDIKMECPTCRAILPPLS